MPIAEREKPPLLKQLIPMLKQRQVRVGLIKHTHHDMDVDTPGKDSYELRKAGPTKRWSPAIAAGH